MCVLAYYIRIMHFFVTVQRMNGLKFGLYSVMRAFFFVDDYLTFFWECRPYWEEKTA